MKISIIVPTFNAEKYIKETLESVFKQSFREWECLIIDGLSQDKTEEVVDKYKSDDRIKFFSEKDNGIYDAMNRGVLKATGDYCIFLGAGDIFYNNDVLTNVVSYLEKKKSDVCCGYVKTIKDGIEGEIRVKPNYIMYCVRFIPVCHQSVFAKTELLKKRPFDTTFKIGADQDWIMCMKKRGMRFSYIDLPIAYYSLEGISSSNSGNDIFKVERCTIHNKYYPLWYKIISWHRSRRN